ncbi:MAG: TetR/AcrR family transcriptional regulator C-terminal domain-containing protein [Pseudomonadota bacterium]
MNLERQSADDLKQRLIDLGTDLLTAIDQPTKIQFGRLVHEPARHYPELARVCYETLYDRTQAHLATLIATGQSNGLFRPGVAPTLLADQLLGMWLGLSRTKMILGIAPHADQNPETRSREEVLTLSR